MENTIKRALKSSGEMLMQSFGEINKVFIKQTQSHVVTKADLDSEKNIVSIIEKDFPKHSIIAEETGFKDKNSQYIWVADPLDGTSNFASRLPSFGISIGVLKDFEPIIGGVYLPFYQSLYFAEKGKGAFLNNEKISVSAEKDLKKMLLSYGIDFSENESQIDFEVKTIKEFIQSTRNLRSTNSIVDLCYTADGRLGGYVHHSTKIWDLAAISLIIEEAGGLVTDIKGHELDFKVNQLNFFEDFPVIASSKELHPKILALIEKNR